MHNKIVLKGKVMHKILLLLSVFSFSATVLADNVILMIGDGMGSNHLKCAALEKPLYLSLITPSSSMVGVTSAMFLCPLPIRYLADKYPPRKSSIPTLTIPSPGA